MSGESTPLSSSFKIMAGQATCGLELLKDVPDLDTLITTCGGGVLFAGTSTAAKALPPAIRCFPVESELSNDTQKSFPNR